MLIVSSLIIQLAVLVLVAATELVNVQPPVLVTGVGRGATFTCESSTVIVHVEWMINGSSLNSLQLSDIQEIFSGIGILQFSSVLLEYNNTRIQCRANTTTRGGVVMSGISTLFVQGLLSAVESLSVNITGTNANIRWRAPFTLDLTSINPDITYCVDVVSSTSSATLHSECGITATEFTYSLPPRSGCDVYNFTVTPVNLVGNGTKETTVYPWNFPTPEVMTIMRSSIFTSYSLAYIAFMTAPVCNAELTFVDINTEEIITLEDSDLTIAETNITFTTQQLRQNRQYNVTATASVNGARSITYFFISTHGVRRFAIVNKDTAGIFIQTNYFELSSATGALYYIIMSGAADLTGAVYLALDRNTSHNHTLPFSLSGGRMEVFVYDIESDGTLASGVAYPAVSREVTVTREATQGPPFQVSYSLLKSCKVITSSHIILVECAYPSHSAATGFQMIAQKSNSSVNRLYIDQAVNFQASASVIVEENGLYQVAVFPIRGRRGIVDFSVEFMKQLIVNDSTATTEGIAFPIQTIAGMGVGLALLTAALIIMLAILCFRTSSKKKGQADQKQGAAQNYDIPQLYEEIKDIEITARETGTAVPTPQYEDVIPTSDTSKCTDPYQITQCSAYGTPFQQH